MSLEEGFLKDCIKRLHSCKEMGDKTFEQLENKDYYFQPSAESNSIAIIVQHLYGNMMSRFTNFLTEDGDKPWRKRDAEFELNDISKEDILSFWNTAWQCVFTALENLKPADLTKTIYIRSEPFTIYDAILRHLMHASSHIGQIIYIGKMIKGANWQSLSIPKSKK